MKEKILKKIMKVLSIITICLISFGGIYIKENNQYKNQVKEYEKASDLIGYRQLTFEVSDANLVLDSEGKTVGNTDNYDDETIAQNSYQKSETNVNAEENRTIENYKKAKKIIEKRLQDLGVTNYNISMNEENGKIFLNIAENDETDHAVSNLLQVSKFEIRDSEDESKVIIKGKDLKKASALYNTTEQGTTVYLQLELNKEATKTFADITANEYKKMEKKDDDTSNENEATAEIDTSNEENENNGDKEQTENNDQEEEKQKEIVLAIDNNKMITTSFEEPITDGILDLSMGSSSKDSTTIQNSLKTTSTIALLLNSGELPLTYKATQNQFVKNSFIDDNLMNIVYISIAAVAVLIVIMVLKYKSKGIMGAISFLGFIAIYLLLIRYTNVAISLEGLLAIAVVSIAMYLGITKLLKINEPDIEIKKKTFAKEYKSFVSKIVPILIISIVFSFMKWESISTFGMVSFWGTILALIYNVTITKKVVD